MKQSSDESRVSRANKRSPFRFERIETWQRARAFNKAVYAATRRFPKVELFALTSQLRRASVSVSSNIAEGSGRNSDTDFAHFLEIAYGSLMEVVSQLFIALDESYIGQHEFDILANDADRLAAKIVALSKSLEPVMNFLENKTVHCNYIQALRLGWNQKSSGKAAGGSVIQAMLPMKSGRSAPPISP